jgi:hypothetical protein
MAKTAKKLPKKPKKFIDSDKDGLSDWEEVNIYGSDPFDDDTDGDGVEDGEQVLQGRHPVTGEKFKDFFIPHKGNNYQPKSLHPKRVAFHIASALLVKMVIVFFVILYPISAWMSPDLIAEQSRKIIALTNQLRKSLDLKDLKENSRLNQAAYNKVQDMFINQYFAHTSPDKKNLEAFLKQAGYNFSISGENLAVGFSDAIEVVEAWKNSPTHYSNLVDTDFSEIGVSMAEGLFRSTDNVLTAQYFALPNVDATPTKAVVKTNAPVKTPAKIESGTKAVLSVKEDVKDSVLDSASSTDTVSSSSATVASSSEPVTEIIEVATNTNSVITASIIIDQPEKQTESLVKVMANLAPETMTASAQVMDTNIELMPTVDNSWEGQQIIHEKAVMVPPTITTVDNTGASQVTELDSSDIQPKKTSLSEKYLLLRNNPNNSIEKVLDISSIYFKVILILAIISLLLNIFIQIKKQHPKLILSGLAIIILLIMLLIF